MKKKIKLHYDVKFKPSPRLHFNALSPKGRIILLVGIDLIVDAEFRLCHNQLLLGVCKNHSLKVQVSE